MQENTEEHFEGKVAQKAILVKDGKVLLTRDSRDVVYELPGGRLNKGEEPKAGLARELKEELGVDVVINEPVHISQFEHKRDGFVALVVVYRVTLSDESAEFTVDPVEVTEMQWVDSNNWKDYKLFPEYVAALEEYFSS